MTNFDYLKKELQFSSFSEVAISSEKLLPIDREACVINCGRAMEFAVKWLYSVDDSLQKPYQDNLHSLMSTEEFHALIEENKALKEELTRRREAKQPAYVPKPLDLSEYKTRKIYIDEMLKDAGWIRNVLFLADRNSLVTQAKRSFVNQFPEELSVANVVEEKSNYHARCVFSTYQTMINLIDNATDREGRIFSCGHFDLIICDEAHRSIYNKYRDIFTYFDALLVGLTATPKEEIDKNTYAVFELEDGVPTYGYDLAQAVKDGYLVDYLSVESEVKFIERINANAMV